MKANESGNRMRQSWEPMTLTYLGHVGEVLQGGGGKMSTQPADPGEFRKPQPSGPES